MNKKLIILIVLILIVAAGLYYFFVFRKPKLEVAPITPLEKEEKGLGGELLKNPGQKVPETNPFEKVETNPLKGTNPFEGIYKNPFLPR